MVTVSHIVLPVLDIARAHRQTGGRTSLVNEPLMGQPLSRGRLSPPPMSIVFPIYIDALLGRP